jgi:hypothetical protein
MLCTMRVPIDGLSLKEEEEYPYIIIGGDNGCCRAGSSLRGTAIQEWGSDSIHDGDIGTRSATGDGGSQADMDANRYDGVR